MNTSDLSGNESSEGSGKRFHREIPKKNLIEPFRKSNTSW